NAGFTFTSEPWLNAYFEKYQAELAKWEYTPWDHFRLPEPRIDGGNLSASAQDTDTAIYVVKRLAGESSDRKVEKGNFILDDNEIANLSAIANTFDKVILILNTCGPIDLSFLDEIKNIGAILYVSLPGMEAGNAVASVLTGEANACGKLSATWARKYEDYPSAQSFLNCDTYYFSEDIYVGYRWFETFDYNREMVVYPFGYGLSYTTFDFSNIRYAQKDANITVNVKVTNTGACAGKEVVQLYHGAPLGKLGKSAVSLVAYKKTKLLAPGESEAITLTFAVEEMASYDDEGATGNQSCYVLEEGEYPIYLGTSANKTELIKAGEYVQKELKVTKQLTRYLSPVQSFEVAANLPDQITRTVMAQESTADAVPTDNIVEEVKSTSNGTITYSQVLKNIKLLDAYIDQFDNSELAKFVRLTPGKGVGYVGGYKLNDETKEHVLSDGVCGVIYELAKSATYPCPTCLAQTFNDDLVTKVAQYLADQFIRFEFDNVLAPGVNIHQNPLCGRNFGYFSEDPLLSGNMGAAYIKGIHTKGIATTPKHFAANTKEDNRSTIDCVVSERALREIYLKSFQVTLAKSDPWSVMTSYNRINGVETAERSDLINGILRKEWGF
ncbi:MAG: glycoside hydrolase family 3 C-terminal domain-containing protein, partial [Clostridia bacterium]|nr:glycoside hydrolase family 3 C-terminal domain-containing protein [Clostridia bacterium]